MARELGKSLSDLLDWRDSNDRLLPLTHRQMLTWDAWMRDQYDHPSREDFYLMALRASLINVNGGNVTSLEDLVLKFQKQSTKAAAAPPPDQPHIPGLPRPVTKDDLSKMMIAGFMATTGTSNRPDPSGTSPHPRAVARKQQMISDQVK